MDGDLPAAAVSITVIGIENGSGGGNHAARGADQRYLQVGQAQIRGHFIGHRCTRSAAAP